MMDLFISKSPDVKVMSQPCSIAFNATILQEKLGSTKEIDYIYHILNTSGLSKGELTNTVKELNSEELLELAKS